MASTFPAPAGAKGVLGSSEALPVKVDEITPAWMSKVLGKKVKEVKVTKELHGTASKILVGLTYEEGEEGPKSVCVKGGFNPAIVALHPALNIVYRREAEFYYYVGPTLDMRLPTIYYCGTDTVTGQGILVMADLEAEGCTFGECLEPWPVERVRAGVEQLAILHAKTWGGKAEDYPWLSADFNLRQVITGLMQPEPWAGRFDGDARPPVPEYLADRERIVAAYNTLWSATDSKFWCLLHGDSHISNTYISPAGEPGFLDWQGVHTGSAIHDIAYFIVGSMDIAERRTHERSLFAHYLDHLYAAGGPRFAVDDAWTEYRKHNLHGFAWAMTPPVMQSKERVDVMSERHCAAIVDHKSLELLESLPEHKKA